MEITGRTVLILGGSGLVGLAVARRVLARRPAALVLTALTRSEVDAALDELRTEGIVADETRLIGEYGDVFRAESLKDVPRGELLGNAVSRAQLLDDLFGELTDDVVQRSAFGALILRHRPEIVVDCVNTATAFAYQNIYESASALRAGARAGTLDVEAVEQHLATLYLPQLIRHVQIALDSMRRADTQFYLKVGTAGTGGMGLNIPFTHSEERPSRMLLSKSAVAGAHTLLLYLMARTPDAPAVKELKPTAAISWKRIGYGEIRKKDGAVRRYDAAEPLPLADAFRDGAGAFRELDGVLEGVFIDAGENGLFSLGEFESLTALGLMEYVTPEEIADDVLREIRGHPTGRDVVAALDGATMGPSYRAGVMRQVAIDRMEELESEHGVAAVAYEMLGPPRLSKLLFEAAILGRLFDGIDAAARLVPDETAARADALLREDADLRVRILSIGLPILLPDGQRVLRGPDVKVAPEPGQSPHDPRLARNGWVDLTPASWARWREWLDAMRAEMSSAPGPDDGSRADWSPADRRGQLRPGTLAAWVFRRVDGGERIKR